MCVLNVQLYCLKSGAVCGWKLQPAAPKGAGDAGRCVQYDTLSLFSLLSGDVS